MERRKKRSLSPNPTAGRLEFGLGLCGLDKKYCFFYINSESSYETCGLRRDIVDVPELFIVRYKRNSTKAETKIERRPKTIWDSFQEDVDDDLASQLVARYNGSVDIPQIIQWVSQIIKDGDSRDLPFFRTNSPELIPEDGDAIWSRGAQSVLSTSNGMKYKIHKIITNVYDSIGDPRLGPFLLLAALVSFGSMWMQRNRSTQTSQSSQPRTKEKPGPKRRARTKETSRKDRPPSMTDDEPKDATQLLPSESDSD
ncbi:hypothetical protein GIB67_011929 [Kingdonia uniflora]|uniref:Uncharacterized protein n=1 Tax=Kingdonia uniflora TaxID=39325 RepID=A0A7J7M026_9MAGN|nr:hypothetical protein GIB67_011929 [Kingdonia uniflora]